MLSQGANLGPSFWSLLVQGLPWTVLRKSFFQTSNSGLAPHDFSAFPQTNFAKKVHPEAKAEAEINTSRRRRTVPQTTEQQEFDETVYPALREKLSSTLLLVYFILTIMALWFGKHILSSGVEYNELNSTFKNFCLAVEGFPAEATDPEKIGKVLQAWLGDENPVVGVSIAYEVSPQDKLVIDSAMDQWAMEMDGQKPLQWLRDAQTDEANEDGAIRESSGGIEMWTQRREKRLGVWDEDKPKDEICMTLQALKSSGTVYVCLANPGGIDIALDEQQNVGLTREDPEEPGRQLAPHPPLEWEASGTTSLTMHQIYSEPEEIHWGNHKQSMGRAVKVPIATCGCCCALYIFFMISCPFTMAYMHAAHIPGVDSPTVPMMILGLIPAAGCLLMYLVVDWAIEFIGYKEKSFRDYAVLIFGFLFSFVTVIVEMVMILAIAQGGAVLDSEGEVGSASFNYDRVLARELFNQLIPSYIVYTAFIAALFECNFIPWYSYQEMRMVPMRMRGAERWSEPCQNDFSMKYTLTLTGVAALFSLLTLMSPKAWIAMSCCIFMLLMTWFVAQWTMTRGYAVVPQNTVTPCWVALHIWGILLSLLVGVAVFWGTTRDTDPYDKSMTALSMKVHIVVFFICLQIVKKMVPLGQRNSSSYTDTLMVSRHFGRFATYFNTNHVHCLKRKYLQEMHGEDSCLPWMLGKMHYHDGAPVRAVPPLTFGQEFCCCSGPETFKEEKARPHPQGGPGNSEATQAVHERNRVEGVKSRVDAMMAFKEAASSSSAAAPPEDPPKPVVEEEAKVVAEDKPEEKEKKSDDITKDK